MPNYNQRLMIEQLVREAFNAANGTKASKQHLYLPGGQARHEFDLYEQHQVIGGVSTSPWRTAKSGANNTGGQDRASAEIFLLTLWKGPERRVHVLTDEEMAIKLHRRYRGIPMAAQVDICHYSLRNAAFTVIGSLGT